MDHRSSAGTADSGTVIAEIAVRNRTHRRSPDTMPSREFTDAGGRRWRVWDVQPTLAERRHGAPDTRRPPPRERRRRGSVPRVAVNAALSGGWLCFERDGEKRRLAPVPEHWLDASDEELDALCRRSTPAPPTRRLIE